jgi:polysaccharide export outer membrane protein
MKLLTTILVAGLTMATAAAPAWTQKKKKNPAPAATAQPSNGPAAAEPSPDKQYVIGAGDVLGIDVWHEGDFSGQVQVRPDGKITLKLLNDVQAAGVTTEQLAADLTEKLKKYLEQPRVTVSVVQINSKKIFVVGEVNKSGSIALTPGMTVLQALAQAGGPNEFANTKRIYVLRTENGQKVKYPVNYRNLIRGSGKQEDLALMPGDTIVVP